LSTGYLDSCGILNDGRLVCWGDDDWVAEAPDSDDFVALSNGTSARCALTADGHVECWCAYDNVQHICRRQPSNGGYVEVQSGEGWACAERPDHTLRCWGAVPRGGEPPTGAVADWSIELNVGCWLSDSGEVTCWGVTRNWGGLLDYTETEPLTAPPEGVKLVQVAVGRNHVCGLDTEGEIHCWGVTAWQDTPYPPAPPGPFVSITAWNQVTCAVRADATAECWYDFPQLNAEGWGPPPGKRWAQIGLGEWDACGLTVEGDAHCWTESSDTEGEVSELPSLDDL
jgi:hypothetical protein